MSRAFAFALVFPYPPQPHADVGRRRPHIHELADNHWQVIEVLQFQSKRTLQCATTHAVLTQKEEGVVSSNRR